MSAVEKYSSTMIDALWGDNRYHIDPRRAVELADAAIAKLEAITAGQLKTITKLNAACVRAEAALAEMKVDGNAVEELAASQEMVDTCCARVAELEGRRNNLEYNEVVALCDRYQAHIEDIAAHATPFGDIPAEPGYIGSYLLSAGALHRALGTLGHTMPSCQAEAENAAKGRVIDALHGEWQQAAGDRDRQCERANDAVERAEQAEAKNERLTKDRAHFSESYAALHARFAQQQTKLQKQVERREGEKLRAVQAEAERDALKAQMDAIPKSRWARIVS